MKPKITEAEIEAMLDKYRFNNSEINLTRLPLARENHLLSLVQQGRYRDVLVRDFANLDENLGRTAAERKRNYEYIAVACITLCTRAAIAGNAPADDAFDLSDTLLQRLANVSTMEEIQDIFQMAPVLFAKMVYNARRSQKSYQIEQCRIYISRNIYRRIRIEDIAAFVGLNRSYLSHLFATTEGITLHDYIQREKTEVACNLLRYSDQPICAIAQYMGFPTQSSFDTVFRKWQGMTPSQFRNLHFRDIYSDHP